MDPEKFKNQTKKATNKDPIKGKYLGVISSQTAPFGPFLEKGDISKIFDLKCSDVIIRYKRKYLLIFFKLSLNINTLLTLSEEIWERYKEITTKELYISQIPYSEIIRDKKSLKPLKPQNIKNINQDITYSQKIYERLTKPLQCAKKNYCFGDYIATIVLCGIFGEMLAICFWKNNNTKLNNKSITEQDEIGIFGSSFEKLNQDKRLKILETFGYITETQYESFNIIREKRRLYLHLWTPDLKREQIDALDVLKKSFQLLKSAEILLLDEAFKN